MLTHTGRGKDFYSEFEDGATSVGVVHKKKKKPKDFWPRYFASLSESEREAAEEKRDEQLRNIEEINDLAKGVQTTRVTDHAKFKPGSKPLSLLTELRHDDEARQETAGHGSLDVAAPQQRPKAQDSQIDTTDQTIYQVGEFVSIYGPSGPWIARMLEAVIRTTTKAAPTKRGRHKGSRRINVYYNRRSNEKYKIHYFEEEDEKVEENKEKEGKEEEANLMEVEESRMVDNVGATFAISVPDEVQQKYIIGRLPFTPHVLEREDKQTSRFSISEEEQERLLEEWNNKGEELQRLDEEGQECEAKVEAEIEVDEFYAIAVRMMRRLRLVRFFKLLAFYP